MPWLWDWAKLLPSLKTRAFSLQPNNFFTVVILCGLEKPFLFLPPAIRRPWKQLLAVGYGHKELTQTSHWTICALPFISYPMAWDSKHTGEITVSLEEQSPSLRMQRIFWPLSYQSAILNPSLPCPTNGKALLEVFELSVSQGSL